MDSGDKLRQGIQVAETILQRSLVKLKIKDLDYWEATSLRILLCICAAIGTLAIFGIITTHVVRILWRDVRRYVIFDDT